MLHLAERTQLLGGNSLSNDLATFIQVICAVVQTVMAIVSLGAAWWIALGERRRAEGAEIGRRAFYFDAATALVESGIKETNEAFEAMEELEPSQTNYAPHYWPWLKSLAYIRDALRALAVSAPPEPQLVLAITGAAALADPDRYSGIPGWWRGHEDGMEERLSRIAHGLQQAQLRIDALRLQVGPGPKT